MRFTAWVPASEHERFAPGSWDSQIGHVGRAECFGAKIGRVIVRHADIAADGSGVTLTFDVELEDPARV